MPDYTTLQTEINNFKTAANTLMNSGALSANDLGLVAAALNAIGNSLGVADINAAAADKITQLNTATTSAIDTFNNSTNGARLTTAEGNITSLTNRMTNAEGFISTNGAQYTTLQSTVSALQTSISVVPSNWKIVDQASYQAVSGDRLFVVPGAGRTVTLPLNPSVGQNVTIVDHYGTMGTTNLTVSRNGQKIQGLNEDLIVNVNSAKVYLVYSDAVYGWRLV